MQQGRIAVVVGGASGIGRATVGYFAARGVSVAIFDVVDASAVAAEVQAAAKGDVRVTYHPCDVSSSASIKAAIDETHSSLGRIDFAVNTAGVTGPTVEGHELEDEDWAKIMRIDLEGTWRFSKAIITYWRSQPPRTVRDDSARGSVWKPVEQRGSLVNVASSLGSEGKQYLAAYSAAKHGVIGLSKSLALENAEHGIRVNTISPGLCFTPLLSAPGYDLEKAKREYLTDQPMARFAHPHEIAAGIYFTASDAASFMTGADWGPDGGAHIR